MISLAIPTYNRPEMTIESFERVLDNPLISEIVINDDHSEFNNYIQLWNKIVGLPKVKLSRNNSNLGPFQNKYETVKKCKNEDVILLDSDNIIDNDYLDIISKLDPDFNTLLCPETLYDFNKKVLWTYKDLNKLTIDKSNVQEHIKTGDLGTCLNTGNFFVNRNSYLKVFDQSEKDLSLSTNDAMYFTYLWLKLGMKIQVVEGLSYIHRIHPGSWYKNNAKKCGQATNEIMKLIKQL